MNRKRVKKKSFKELEAEWYGRLKKEGFEDIENTSRPDRPLKEWHSRIFKSDAAQVRRARYEDYDWRLTSFINAPDINEICSLTVKHGNSSLEPKKVKRILELHHGGLTERTIAKKTKCSRDSINRILKKAKAWMKVA